MQDIFISTLIEQLKKPLPGSQAHKKMVPDHGSRPLKFKFTEPPRRGAVLILFYKRNNEWHFPLIQRPNYNGVHSGQIGLPGGKWEKSDTDLTHTALRETEEEIGIKPQKIKVIGALSEFYVGASNHQILPIIGLHNDDKPEFVPDNYEVAEIIEAPVSTLLNHTDIKTKDIFPAPGIKLNSPYFDIHSKVVWGATAMMLSELVEVIKQP